MNPKSVHSHVMSCTLFRMALFFRPLRRGRGGSRISLLMLKENKKLALLHMYLYNGHDVSVIAGALLSDNTKLALVKKGGKI